MSHHDELEILICTELRRLRSRLIDAHDPKETALLALSLGDFCHELWTLLVSSGNTTSAHAQAYFGKLANMVGSHPKVPANDLGKGARLHVVYSSSNNSCPNDHHRSLASVRFGRSKKPTPLCLLPLQWKT